MNLQDADLLAAARTEGPAALKRLLDAWADEVDALGHRAALVDALIEDITRDPMTAQAERTALRPFWLFMLAAQASGHGASAGLALHELIRALLAEGDPAGAREAFARFGPGGAMLPLFEACLAHHQGDLGAAREGLEALTAGEHPHVVRALAYDRLRTIGLLTLDLPLVAAAWDGLDLVGPLPWYGRPTLPSFGIIEVGAEPSAENAARALVMTIPLGGRSGMRAGLAELVEAARAEGTVGVDRLAARLGSWGDG